MTWFYWFYLSKISSVHTYKLIKSRIVQNRELESPQGFLISNLRKYWQVITSYTRFYKCIQHQKQKSSSKNSNYLRVPYIEAGSNTKLDDRFLCYTLYNNLHLQRVAMKRGRRAKKNKERENWDGLHRFAHKQQKIKHGWWIRTCQIWRKLTEMILRRHSMYFDHRLWSLFELYLMIC